SLRTSGRNIENDRHEFPYRKTTDADGRFEYELASLKRPYLQIEAGGFGPMFVLPDVGHETSQTALVVLLDRAATLDLRLVDPTQHPVTGVHVDVGIESYHLQQ